MGEPDLAYEKAETLTIEGKEELIDTFVRDYYECACCGNLNEQEIKDKQKEVKEFFMDLPMEVLIYWMFGEDMEDVPELE